MNCPNCKSPNLGYIEQHAFCHDCDWDNLPELPSSKTIFIPPLEPVRLNLVDSLVALRDEAHLHAIIEGRDRYITTRAIQNLQSEREIVVQREFQREGKRVQITGANAEDIEQMASMIDAQEIQLPRGGGYILDLPNGVYITAIDTEN